MGKDLYIQDTCEVFIRNKVTKDIVGVGYAQTSGLNIEVDSTPIRGGVGNKLAYTIKTSKNLSLNISSATMKPSFFEISQGGEWKDSVTKDVMKSLFVAVTDNAGTLELKLPTELNTLTTARVEDVDGEQQDLAVTSGVIELPVGFGAVVGDELEVFYLKTVTGRAFEIDATKFGSKYQIEYNTICYDRETETPYSNIYFIFEEASSDGNMSVTFNAGEAYIPELTFNVYAPKGSDVLGTKIEELIV